jgi:hypothetical protein
MQVTFRAAQYSRVLFFSPFLSFSLCVLALYLLMGLIILSIFHVLPFSCLQEQWQVQGHVGVVLFSLQLAVLPVA